MMVTPPIAPLGPVSKALEADLQTWVRRHGIVVWLDLDGHYTGFVDRLIQSRVAGELPFDVKAFRGSHLQLMLDLESVGGGIDKPQLVIHLPGFNEETVRATPLLELYAAGVRYRKALDTLVTEAAAGRVRPERIAAFQQQQAGLTLEGADTWLTAQMDDQQDGLAAQLRDIQPTALIDDLLQGGVVAGRVGREPDDNAIWERLAVLTGVNFEWFDLTSPAVPRRAEDIAFSAAGWALCVEYVDDLKRAPVSAYLQGMGGLPRGVIDTCRELAAYLRNKRPDFYRRTADETEAILSDEIDAARAEDLGRIDTFRFEEDLVLKAALAALGAGEWQAALDWASIRVGDGSFWIRGDMHRRSAWQLIEDAARLGCAITQAGPTLGARDGLAAALDRYMAVGAAVDQAHRHLEQRRSSLLYPQLPEFETLRACLDTMRQAWRTWADAWALEFSAACRSHGFLPEAGLQQRNLFDDVVKPLTQETGPTAYFLVDAFRYEMGVELLKAIDGTPATTAHLNGRFAELPTITDVGMNVLAPVAVNGKLKPAISDGKLQGFSTGEFRVKDPETRKRAMHARVGGLTCPWLTLEEVVTRDAPNLKNAISKAKLVIVHSQEIDNAGETGVGPAVFDHVMQKLRAAWQLLREAGVRRFVFTADHGFLLLDETARTAQGHGRRVDPKRRHVFSPAAADHSGEVRVSAADLGYEGLDIQLMMPESTAIFDVGRGAGTFAHGGNSLQERVIPVLTVVHRSASGGNTVRYGITATACEGVAGMHCLSIKVGVVDQGVLDFGTPREVELALRVPELAGVQVELCQARGKGRIVGGAIVATVGEAFELFFRLSGDTDARALVEVGRAGAVGDIAPCTPDTRFEVTVNRAASEPAAPTPAGDERFDWLSQLPEGGIRQVFEHLSAHGAVTEAEAMNMLGSARALRGFALKFEELAAKAPFAIRIDTVGGVKRYTREGAGS